MTAAPAMSPGSKTLISRWRRAKVVYGPKQVPACMPAQRPPCKRALGPNLAGKEAAVQPQPDKSNSCNSGQSRHAAAADARVERGRDVPAGDLAARAADAGALV